MPHSSLFLLDHVSDLVCEVLFLLLNAIATLVANNVNDLDRAAQLLSLSVNIALNSELVVLNEGLLHQADLRIELAERYLAYSGMTVEEVAYACGYKNVVHFSRQFKQIIGRSPREAAV